MFQEDLSVTTTTTSTGTSTAGAGASTVNKAIYQLAQKYCGDCKGAFDELSKIIQKVGQVILLVFKCGDGGVVLRLVDCNVTCYLLGDIWRSLRFDLCNLNLSF